MEHSLNDTEIKELIKNHPLLRDMIALKEVFWRNPEMRNVDEALNQLTFGMKEVQEAESRLKRFASYFMKVFPETRDLEGVIESPLTEIGYMKENLNQEIINPIEGRLYLKEDNLLPVSGSIKARGGIYEVLKTAESIAIDAGLLSLDDDYAVLTGNDFKNLYSKYTIVVGSTGNLGLSIGIISAKIGFNVTVHMSSDAKTWKKEMLRQKGVKVVEHRTDYGNAVAEGRKEAQEDPFIHFVDDENSKDLFFGYAVAALRLEKQLQQKSISVDENHPLFVYLPCGVGGGPGGVAFGLKLIFGDNVHCFFAEPTHSPSMLTGLLTGLHDSISVQELGIDNKTEADGLAVGRPSRFVGKVMENMINGVFTVSDDHMFQLLKNLADTENIYMEPSALAGLAGPVKIFNDKAGNEYLHENRLTTDKLKSATHISWGTGGSMVPQELMDEYYSRSEG